MAAISIIIPCFNSEVTILETLESLKNQSFTDFECVIVDDCSTDKTVFLINSYISGDARFSVVQLSENMGASACRNRGIENSSADFILFLDSDDLLSPYCLKQRMAMKQENQQFSVFPNYFKMVSGKIEEVIKTRKDFEQTFVLKDFIVHTLPLPWNISSVIWKKSTLSELNGFDISYFRMQDVEIMTRALLMEYSYEIHLLKPDFIYRATETVSSIKGKRLKFYEASLHYISHILSFTRIHAQKKLSETTKYLRKFMFFVLGMTLVSGQFSEKESVKLLEVGSTLGLLDRRQNSVLKRLVRNRWLRAFIQLPVIRGVFWRFLAAYVKKN